MSSESTGLWAERRDEAYGAGDFERLLARCRGQDLSAVLVPLDSIDQLRLLPNGRTAVGGLRYSYYAACQVARLLSSGLASLISDLSGVRRRAEFPSAPTSEEEAVVAFNSVLSRRFVCVSGSLILTDSADGVLEAIVGTTYRRLPNSQYLEQAAESVPAAFAFHSAYLRGRSVASRWASPVELASVPLGPGRGADSISSALYFANSETGDGAARAFPSLRHSAGGFSVAASEAGGHVQHKGKDFPRRVSKAICQASAFEFDAAGVAAMAASLSRPAGLTSSNLARRTAALGVAFSKKSLTVGFGVRCVRSAVLAAAGEGPADLSLCAASMPGVTNYDLYLAVCREAAETPYPFREAAEQAAYRLLDGSWRLPPAGGGHNAVSESEGCEHGSDGNGTG